LIAADHLIAGILVGAGVCFWRSCRHEYSADAAFGVFISLGSAAIVEAVCWLN